MRATSNQLRLTTALALIALPAIGRGQLPNASPTAAGIGAYTAMAHGLDAVAWNPAGLGMPGNPILSFTAGVINVGTGLKPISLNDISPYYGQPLPASIRESWMQRIEANSGEQGTVDGGITPVALSIGPLAFQVGTQMVGTMNLAPGIAEALLFGNEGRTDTVRTLSFTGSNVNIGAFTTGAVSYGLSLPSAPLTHMAIGITGKYVIGNFLARGQDLGSALGKDSLTADFPIIMSVGGSANGTDSSKFNPIAGKGYGMDLGFAWSNPVFTLGVQVQNVMNTFAWDTTRFSTNAVTATFRTDTSYQTTTKGSFAAAPQALRDSVTKAKFQPAVNVGAAMALDHNTTLAVDVRHQVSDGISNEPQNVLAGGLEWRGIPFIALRGGGAYLTDGWGASGGFGIHLGPYELALAGVVRAQNGGRHGTLMVSALTLH